GKRVWRSPGGKDRPSLSHTPEVTWYGYDGDRLVTTQTADRRVQTVYMPGSFTPLLRAETELAELEKAAAHRTLAQKLQQEANMTFVPELVMMLDVLEGELRRGEVSEPNRQWLAQCGLTPEQMKNQTEPEYVPRRKIHLYHCDHRGLPLALIRRDGGTAWQAEYDEWGNVLREDNPEGLEQLIRLPGQQYDEETGLYYNRHRYYDPQQGRYITQDPTGLRGGWNPYTYPLNPVTEIDPLGLFAWLVIPGICAAGGCEALAVLLGLATYTATPAGQDAMKNTSNAISSSLSNCNDKAEELQQCSPPSGTICYFYDQVPPAKPHYPHAGSHYHLFKMGEAPYCRWNKFGSEDIAPPGSIPCPFPRTGGR
ncbi:RHS repeat-associated core domain-containing protein, partial [Citrobacter rodentium]